MNDLRGARVLVTGADGFIGSHLVERLLADGAIVRALCQYNSFGSIGWLRELPRPDLERVEVRLGDIRDAAFVDELCVDVDVAFHLAALISIPYSYSATESYLDTNVRGTLNVLNAARRRKVARVVHTSTSEVYGTPTHLPIRETHPLNAQSPYAATKIAADQLALAYHRSFGVPVTILRPFNTFGPRQSTRAVMTTVLAQLLSGSEVLELGRLDPRRDLTYVTDTVDGFCRAAVAPDVDGAVIQLGTGRAVSIGELVAICGEVTGTKPTVRIDPRRVRPDASEVEVLESDPSVALERLGWTPKVSLERGVALTAGWVRANLAALEPERLLL